MARHRSLSSKYDNLKKIIRKMDSFILAYSGGVDSMFLLKAGYDILDKKVLAVTAKSETYPGAELRDAVNLAKAIGAKHRVVITKELKNRDFISNPPDRCYFCKRELFSLLKEIAEKEKIRWICDGSNIDDLKDYRPGTKAKSEFGIRSPLQEAGLTKDDIRRLSRKLKLPTWNKPSMACLSSRIPYGEKIDKQKLKNIEKAEKLISSSGFKSFRVRVHNNIARIEVGLLDLKKFIQPEIRKKIIREFKSLGFIYITLDLEGFRSGSMNEVFGKS